MRTKEPTFESLCAVIRESCGLDPEGRITANTQFQRDLGITDDDGEELLEDVEEAFAIRLSRESFNLGPYESLFGSEEPGIGFISLGLSNQRPVVRSLTVGELYEAVVKERARQAAPTIQQNKPR